MTIENTAGMFVEYPFEKLAAGTIRTGMIDEYMVVDMLVLVHKIQSKNFGMGSPAFQFYTDVIADKPAIEHNGISR